MSSSPLRLLLIACFLNSGACSQAPETAVTEDAVIPVQDRSPDHEETSGNFLLTADVGDSTSYALAVAPARAQGQPIELVVVSRKTHATGDPVYERLQPDDERLAVDLTTSDGIPLTNPVALRAMPPDGVSDGTRVYLVLGGSDDPSSPRSVAEYVVALESIDSAQGDVIRRGRLFELPVRGPLSDIRLTFTPDRSTLTVNIAASPGARREPVAVVYDIGPASTTTQPIDIRMPPLN